MVFNDTVETEFSLPRTRQRSTTKGRNTMRVLRQIPAGYGAEYEEKFSQKGVKRTP
jgi:hypothetical protein